MRVKYEGTWLRMSFINGLKVFCFQVILMKRRAFRWLVLLTKSLYSSLFTAALFFLYAYFVYKRSDPQLTTYIDVLWDSKGVLYTTALLTGVTAFLSVSRSWRSSLPFLHSTYIRSSTLITRFLENLHSVISSNEFPNWPTYTITKFLSYKDTLLHSKKPSMSEINTNNIINCINELMSYVAHIEFSQPSFSNSLKRLIDIEIVKDFSIDALSSLKSELILSKNEVHTYNTIRNFMCGKDANCLFELENHLRIPWRRDYDIDQKIRMAIYRDKHYDPECFSSYYYIMHIDGAI